MDPVLIINSAFLVLNGALKLIATVKSQSGMTDDQILAAAGTQIAENKDVIAKLLANLPQ